MCDTVSKKYAQRTRAGTHEPGLVRGKTALCLLDVTCQQPRHAPELAGAALLVRLPIVGDGHHQEGIVRRPLRIHDVPQVPNVLQHELRRQLVCCFPRRAACVVDRDAAIIATTRQPALQT